MGGIAVFAGADYQASLVAYIAVRMLLGWRLGWTAAGADVPIAVAGEVGGPGDDIRVSLRDRAPLDVQAKRSLAGTQDLIATVARMIARGSPATDSHEIILAVGGGTHVEIRDAFAADVRHFRADRHDHRRRMFAAVLEALPDAPTVLRRLVVVPIDLDTNAHMGAQVALSGLRQVLRDADAAEAAWAVLVRESLHIGRGSRWDRADVERVLRDAGYSLRAVGPDAVWLDQLDLAEHMLARRRPRTARAFLQHLDGEIGSRQVNAVVRRRLCGLQAHAASRLGQTEEAQRLFATALDYLPEHAPTDSTERTVWCHVHTNAGMGFLFVSRRDEAAEAARRVLAIDPSIAAAWSLLVRATDGTLEMVPRELQPDADVRAALASVAAQQQEWDAAVALLEPSILDGAAQPEHAIEFALALLMVTAQPKHGPTAVPDSAVETPANAATAGVEGMQTVPTATGAAARRYERVERLMTDAIATLLDGELEPLLARAYLLRARAYEGLGRREEANADDVEASRLNPTDPNIVLRQAEARMRTQDAVGALALLTDAVVDGAAALLSRRAEARHLLNDVAGAERDLERAVGALGDRALAPMRGLYLDVATTALELGREDLAERLLLALERGEPAGGDWFAPVLRARLASCDAAWDTVEGAYSAALACAHPAVPSEVHKEAAFVYLRAKEDTRALTHLERAGANMPAHPHFANYVKALMRLEEYDQVLTLLTVHQRSADAAGLPLSSLPGILLDAAARVVLQQGDAVRAAALADAAVIANRSPSGAVALDDLVFAAHIHAQLLQRAPHRERLTQIVHEVLDLAGTPAETRLLMARICLQLGQAQRALDLAFRLYRADQDNQQLIAGLIDIAFASSTRRVSVEDDDSPEAAGSETESAVESGVAADERSTAGTVQEPVAAEEDADAPGTQDLDDTDPDVGTDGRDGVVTANTFVRLRTDDGQRWDLFVYADEPVARSKNEFLVDDAAVRDLLGQRAGDVVVRQQGSILQRLSIVRVLPAPVVVVRRLVRTYATRFPGDPRYRLFHVGVAPTLASLGPIIAELVGQRGRSERVFAMYAERTLPLGLIADALGRTTLEVALMISAGAAPRLLVDGPPYFGYGASVEAARAAATVVLTRPALAFLDGMGHWDALAEGATLLAARSMIDEWEAEIAELETLAIHGGVTMHEEDGRPRIARTTRAQAAERLARSRELYSRVLQVARVEFRPASTVGRADRERRELLGAASFDACALARATGATLYADDLGLRALAHADQRVPSFSTSALLEARAASGRLGAVAHETATLQLLRMRHDLLAVRPATIVAAYRVMDGGRTGDRVIDCLGDPRVQEQSAAVVGASALHALTTSTILTVPLEHVSRRLAQALIAHRAPRDVIPIYEWALEQRFRWLPRELAQIRRVTRDTIRERMTLGD